MSRLEIGSFVCISGNHPHAGRSGTIEGIYRFKFTDKAAVKIDFPDGDGCFVFQGDGIKLLPIERRTS